jgi:hypothetical protein
MMVVPLPVREPDPVRVLHLVAAETVERNKKTYPQAMSTGIFRFAIARRAIARLSTRQWLSLFLDRHGQANRSSNSALAGHRLFRSNAVPKLTLRQVSAAPLPCQNRRLTSVTDGRSGSTLA